MTPAAHAALLLSALLQAAPALGEQDALTPTENRWLAGAAPVVS